MQEDAEAPEPSSGAQEADMMQEDEEANAGPSLCDAEASDMTQGDEEDAARPDASCSDDGDEVVGDPSSTDGAERTIQSASLSTKHKAMMKMMLQRMFRSNAGACLELAKLVKQFNKAATTPASAEQIQQASPA